MVTAEQLVEQLSRRPFTPSRVTLNNGEAVDIVRIAQAVVTRQRLSVVTPDGDRMRHIDLKDVDRVDDLGPRRT